MQLNFLNFHHSSIKNFPLSQLHSWSQRWKKSKPYLGTLIQGELLSAKSGNSIAKIGQTEMCAPFAER